MEAAATVARYCCSTAAAMLHYYSAAQSAPVSLVPCWSLVSSPYCSATGLVLSCCALCPVPAAAVPILLVKILRSGITRNGFGISLVTSENIKKPAEIARYPDLKNYYQHIRRLPRDFHRFTRDPSKNGRIPRPASLYSRCCPVICCCAAVLLCRFCW